MKQVTVNGNRYVAVNINTDILLTDKNIETLYHNFFLSRENGTFDGSFTEYCEFCFITAASFYFLDASRLKTRDRDATAVLLYDDRDFRKEMEGAFSYGRWIGISDGEGICRTARVYRTVYKKIDR